MKHGIRTMHCTSEGGTPMSQSSSDRPADHHVLRPGPLPLYQLILHRGTDADPMRILRTVIELTRFTLQEASRKIDEAQNQGRCRLLVTHKERAELFAELFTRRKLAVSVEPV